MLAAAALRPDGLSPQVTAPPFCAEGRGGSPPLPGKRKRRAATSAPGASTQWAGPAVFWRRMRRERAAAASRWGARSRVAESAPCRRGGPAPARHGGRAAEQPAGAAAAPLGPQRPQQAAPATEPAGVSTEGPRGGGGRQSFTGAASSLGSGRRPRC